MDHVDLLVNDWAAHKQVLLARVTATDTGTLKVESDDPSWEQRLHEPVLDPLSGRRVSPDCHPNEFLAVLARKYRGTYVEATAIHNEASCLFGSTREVAMKVRNVEHDAPG
jgi:hypothetical protein